MWWQRCLFCVVGSVILSVAFAVALGLLECTSGPSPSLLLQLVILIPAILWAIPVFLSVTLTIFRMNDDAAVRQIQERAGIHIVHLLLYFVFLRTSELDNLAGAGNTRMCAMCGLTLLGFIVQIVCHMRRYSHVYFFDSVPEQVCSPQQEAQEPGQRELVVPVLGRPMPQLEEHESLVITPDKVPLYDSEEPLNNAELVATCSPLVHRNVYYN